MVLSMETSHRIAFDSATKLSGLDAESVDLVVTSPPYPMIEMWDPVFGMQAPEIQEAIEAGNGYAAFEKMHGLLDKVWEECYRVLKPGGFACINIGDATRKIGDSFRLYTNHSRITSSCESLGFQSLPAIIWRKQTNAPNKFMGSGMLPAGAYVTLEHEYVLVLRKGGRRSFAERQKISRQSSAFFWEERNVWFSDLWDFKGIKQRLATGDARRRSGAFPFELAFRLINMYSLQQDVVLDPFLGTGTTAAAAMTSGRNSLGFEIDEGLGPLIDGAIQSSIGSMNDRQLLRIQNHREFLEDYRNNRGRVFVHHNDVHDFAVMTRQEINLSIPMITKISKVAKAEYRVDYRLCREPLPSVRIDGFESLPAEQVQLDLSFMD